MYVCAHTHADHTYCIYTERNKPHPHTHACKDWYTFIHASRHRNPCINTQLQNILQYKHTTLKYTAI